MRRMLGCIASLVLLLAGGVALSLPASAAEVPVEAIADGDQVVPGPGDPEGVALGDFVLDDETNELCYRVVAFELTLPATELHIYEGAVGVDGDVVATLDEAVVDESFDEEECQTIDPAVADGIAADPSGFYMSIHTSDFPDGAVRGQLETPPEPTIVGTAGDGSEVVPGPGDPGGTLVAAFALFEEDGVVCGLVRAENIALPATAMDIHQAPRGQAGPAVVTLDPASIGTEEVSCVDADPAVVAAIAADPGNYYLDIHTDDFPDGAVRGQLEPEAAFDPIPPPATSATATTATTAALPRSVPAGSGGQAAVDGGGSGLGLWLIVGGGGLVAVTALTWRRRGAQTGSA
jgi:CHRD domain